MNAQAAAAKSPAAKPIAVVSGGNTKGTGKAILPSVPQKKTSAEFAKDVESIMPDPAKVAAKKAEAADEAKLKQDALDQKAEDAKRIELQKAKENGEQANALSETVVNLSQDLVRMQFQFKKAGPEEQKKIKAESLAKGVLLLETIEKAQAPLKASKSSMLGRMKSVFEWDPSDLHALVKERKKPKLQLELELGTTRSRLDSMHLIVEANGAPRIGDDKVVKPDFKAKAAGSDA